MRRFDLDDRDKNENRLIEMVDKKGGDAGHSSDESISNESSSSSNNLSSDQDGSSDNDDTSDESNFENKVDFANVVEQVDVKPLLKLQRAATVVGGMSLQNDEDTNFITQNNNRFQIFIHSFQSFFRPKASLATCHATLYEPDIKTYCTKVASSMARSGISAYAQESSQYWQMVSVALADLNESKLKIWQAHPLGKGLLMKALKFFESAQDI